MKFKIEKKGENYMVVNDTTGVVKGVFKKEDDAKMHQTHLQNIHKDALERVSTRITSNKNDIRIGSDATDE